MHIVKLGTLMTWYLILNDDLKDELRIYVEYHSIGSCWWKVGIVFLDHGCWDRTGNKEGGGAAMVTQVQIEQLSLFTCSLVTQGILYAGGWVPKIPRFESWFHQRKLSRFQFEITSLCQSKTKTAKMYIMSPGRDELNGYFPWHIFHRQLSRK